MKKPITTYACMPNSNMEHMRILAAATKANIPIAEVIKPTRNETNPVLHLYCGMIHSILFTVNIDVYKEVSVRYFISLLNATNIKTGTIRTTTAVLPVIITNTDIKIGSDTYDHISILKLAKHLQKYKKEFKK